MISQLSIWKWKSVRHVQFFGTPTTQSMEFTQARIPKWLVISFSSGSSQSRDWTQISHIAGRLFTSWATGKPKNTGVVNYPFSSESSIPRNRAEVSWFQADSLPAELQVIIHLLLCKMGMIALVHTSPSDGEDEMGTLKNM